jgi:NAD(P)H-dependent FMN reductase
LANKQNIFVILGSASKNSANEKLIGNILGPTADSFNITILRDLKVLPHFDPELSTSNPPQEIIDLRNNIDKADGVIICTPEYIFSIPSGLKNAIEWCVATTVFSGKPVGIITASANGQHGHEELKLIMKTVMARFTDKTTLLIKGIKGKIDQQGKVTDGETEKDLGNFLTEFKNLLAEKENAILK